MAKKITINGSGFLSDLTQAWGGTNETDAQQTIHGTAVPPGAEWGINRGEVERYIKQVLGAQGNVLGQKVGDFRTTSPDQNNFIHILCFASKEDAALYDTDSDTYGILIIRDLVIPISTVQADTYLVSLSSDRSATVQYLVKDGGEFIIPLRFNITRVIAATSSQEAVSDNGTLIVERSPNGTSWTQVYSRSMASSMEADGFPDSIDLKGLLREGNLNYIRLRASYPDPLDESGARMLVSTPIVLNVNSVSLGLDMTTAWQDPQIDPSALALSYSIRGTVQREFHLKVTGSVGTYVMNPAPVSSAETMVSYTLPEMQSYGILTHGVKTVEAWLTAGDETVGELESDHLVVRMMVVRSNDASALQPRLLISEMREEVENFVQTRLLAYSVYSPRLINGSIVNDGDAIPMTFLLTNSASDIITAQQTTYSSILVTASPNMRYYLDMTVEIENTGDTLGAFLHVTRDDSGTLRDFLLDSTGSGNIYLRVDNTGGFQPTAGAAFLLNPKQRNNDETNPMTVLNARSNNALVPSVWENFRLGLEDGYIKDAVGESCLRVPAGRRLTIQYNPLAIFTRQQNASVNMEFDVCIRNVTNEDDPILLLAEQAGGKWRGLRLLPLMGYFTTESWDSDEESDFRYQEDVRTHITVNIVNAVFPNDHGDALVTSDKAALSRTSFPLVRVFINGIINRELVYSPTLTEFCSGAMSNGGIVIGQNGADIDIYGIRIWENASLTPQNVLQDYISTLPDSDTKRRLKAENAIIDPNTGLIGLDYISGQGSVTGINKNWLVWHGNEPYHENAHKDETGWLEWGRYDRAGNYLPEFSGTLCKSSKSLPQKNQGTTAKTYYYHNIQWKSDKIASLISVDVNDLHESIVSVWDASYAWEDDEGNPTGEIGAWMLKGGCLGKNFPLPSESAVAYHGTPTSVLVPDGWIDGNGKYRGTGVQIAEGIPMAQKTVNKINYASSMQSHLIGINWLYNELHTAIVGRNTMQQAVSGAVVAKHTEPFLFFTQEEGAQRPVFRGACAWGAGKMDKPSWGYVKSAHADFCMVEGADNDKQLTDMRVPWDDAAHGDSPAKVFYDPEEEAWYYRLKDGTTEKCIDFDGGATEKVGGKEYPKEAFVSYIRAAWNFLYLHAPRIRHYNGTLTEFLADANYAMRPITAETTEEERERIEQAQGRVNTANKYWCHAEGGTATGDYILKRYDYTDGEWVDAGLWNGTAYDVIDLRTYAMTTNAWNALTEAQKNQSDVVNKAFVDAVVADARDYIGGYFNVNSLKFHYCFQNHFIAGTDNCSKNTYYVLDPSTHRFELHQDDVDTTLATDNSGLQSKPYYIDRMHPYAGDDAARTAMASDVDAGSVLYEGYYNVLFDLCELMWEPTRELQQMMRTILQNMASLAGGLGSVESDAMSGVWRALNRYIFDVQRYFPATVFNETARIRYELPDLIGFLSDNRRVRPIKQSLGDQLQAELQFMKRRLVYMASYAAFGEFTAVGSRAGLTGLSEAGESFGMTPQALPGSSLPSPYIFHLVPHQWIYPTGSLQTNNIIDPHVRVAPGAANMPDGYFPLDLSVLSVSDQGSAVLGLNYYREIGNVGDMVANNGQANFTLNGRRLTKFECVPTTFYTSEQLPAFRVNNIIIGSATRLREFNVKGASVGTGTLDLSTLTLAETIDARGTKVSQVRLPATSTLTTLRLPATLTQLRIADLPGLQTLSLEGAGSLQVLELMQTAGVNSYQMAERCNADSAPLTTLRIVGVEWVNAASEIMSFLADITVSDLRGTVSIYEPTPYQSRVDYITKMKFIRAWGAVDETDNPLYITYNVRNTVSIAVTGEHYLRSAGTYQWMVRPTTSYSNDVTEIKWALSANAFGIVIDEDTGVITAPAVATYPSFVTVSVTYHRISGEPIVEERQIGIYDRPLTLGDYVYCDGTYGDLLDDLKPVVGVCFYINRDDPTDRRMVALKDIKSRRWGLSNTTSQTQGITLADDPKYSVYDTPVPNISGANSACNDANMRDEDNGDADGFKIYADTNVFGTQALTTLTDVLGPYKAGDRIPQGKRNTLLIVQHRDKVLSDSGVAMSDWIPVAKDGKTEFQVLDTNIADYVALRGHANYEAYFFPAASYCYAYEPKADNFALDARFRAHNWYLPATGELARISWFQQQADSVNAIFEKAIEEIGFVKLGLTQSCNESYQYPNSVQISLNTTMLIYNNYGKADRALNIRPVCQF